MAPPPPPPHCLELCDDGRHYQFRSPQALRALLGLASPYNTCLAYAPYARNAPHCSRPVNRAKAASVPCLLDRLEGAKIPSIAAEGLLKSLSTHAVCGITGWHQNKAAEVYFDWQHDLWYEFLRVNGLDPRKWGKPAPSMLGWYHGLELARQEQGWETGENDSEDSEVYKSEENDEDDSDEDDDSDDSDEEGITSLSGGSVTDSDAVSDFDEQEDISFDFDDGDSSSGETVATPDTTFSGFDEAEADFYPSTSSQHSSTSGGGHPGTPELSTDSEETPSHGSVPGSPTSSSQPGTDAGSATDPVDEPSAVSTGGSAATPDESEVQDEEDGSPSADEFATHLLAIDDDILQGPATNGSSASATGTHHPGSPVGFRLYPQAPSPASQLKQLLNLMTQTVSQQRRYAGVLYGFMRPSAPGMLKIGVVKDAVVAERPFADPVDHRLATWQAQCGHPVVEVFRKPIACAAAERIESLVHLALRQYRRVEDPPCRRCEKRKRAAQANGGRRSGGKHDEWFEIDAETATRVIDLWATFADQLPYDRFGRLVDFWSAKVEAAKARIGLGSTVESWQETIPQLVEERTRTDLADLISRFYF